MKQYLIGALLLGGALISFVLAYAGKPDASTCAAINGAYQGIGPAPACSSSPNSFLLYLAAVLVIAGILAITTARVLNKERRKLP